MNLSCILVARQNHARFLRVTSRPPSVLANNIASEFFMVYMFSPNILKLSVVNKDNEQQVDIISFSTSDPSCEE